MGLKAMRKDSVIYFINIYSPCALNEKRIMWSELLILKNKYYDGEWILGGDSNAVRDIDERWGRSLNSRLTEIEEFRSFIDCMELIDLPVIGNKCTWINSNGTTSSRLDRFYYLKALFRVGILWINLLEIGMPRIIGMFGS